MGYDAVSIAEQYSLLKESIKELRDSKDEKGGVILAWASRRYMKATEVIEFFKKAPSNIREGLKIGELETELLEFGNTHVSL